MDDRLGRSGVHSTNKARVISVYEDKPKRRRKPQVTARLQPLRLSQKRQKLARCENWNPLVFFEVQQMGVAGDNHIGLGGQSGGWRRVVVRIVWNDRDNCERTADEKSYS